MTQATPDGGTQPSFGELLTEVLRIAVPLMISAGTFSFVLFVDRTMLLWYDGASMSASMAGGNIFWLVACLPVGIVTMSGAIIGQHIGAGESEKVGKLLWQSVWLSLLFMPVFVLAAYFSEDIFAISGQPENLLALESTYLRWLMLGAAGLTLESALSGFFSGIERTSTIMWVSFLTGAVNILLDVLLIFGWGPIPAMGIVGAAIATSLSFWLKAVCFAWLIYRPTYDRVYQIGKGFRFDWPVLRNLIYFGLPSGLMYFVEAAGFTAIILCIGRLGDVPLRAATMVFNFNMVAFIPLIGVSVATSVLMGRHLLESGPNLAGRSCVVALLFGMVYSCVWALGYVFLPTEMLSLYELQATDPASQESIVVARSLMFFIAIFLCMDAAQVILAGALRGAGDTWFVLFAGLFASTIAVAIGILFEPSQDALTWWFCVVAGWITLLAILMGTRFYMGRWRSMRMV